MAITTDQVKALRDQTGVSVMQCRKALEEAGGDMEKALMILKKKSTEIAAKKSDRDAADGRIAVAKGNGKAVLVELNCETDFVAQNSDFVALADAIAEKVLTLGKDSAIAAAPDLINPVIQKIGENIKLGRIVEVAGATLGSYVHNGKTAVVVSLENGNADIAKDVAMHVAAMHPEYVRASEVPTDQTEKAKAMFAEEVAASGKPADIQEKMLAGKLATYFKERTLLDQAFIKNPDMTVEKYIATGNGTLKEVAHLEIGA
jgi:elongation factor Ts